MKKITMIFCGLVLLVSVGCGPSKPPAVIAPSFDPAAIAAKSMELYDKNGDKKLDAEELKATPAIAFSAKTIDTDGDGAISEAEISARIQGWIDMKVALTCPIVKFVDKSGKTPKDVRGKSAVLTPDPVMGGILKTSDPAQIDDNGQCNPSTPGNQDNLGGMAYGFYSVEIQGSKYKNLGVEIYDGAKETDMDSFVITVKK
ncbi:MAG: hypothetical protein J6J31_09990 [Thermoguttaceae bacterium]|nr:hypothetical protein [Thermoguttaceae bacterium]